MLNRVTLVGRITADPEIRYTQTGIPVASFSLAVERRFKSSSGERMTDFIRCVAWRKTAELMSQYVKKGYMLAVDGSLQMNKFQTKEGENRITYEVVAENVQFLDRGGKGGSGGSSSDSTPSYSDEDAPPEGGSYEPSGASNSADNEDDLPF